MRFLTGTDILVIHARIIDAIGGSRGVRDVGLLQSIVARPQTQIGGVDMFGTIFEKAAAYLEATVQYHVFVDGNKRAAFASAAYFLHMNGHALRVSSSEVEEYMVRVPTEKISVEAIAEWLEKHSAG